MTGPRTTLPAALFAPAAPLDSRTVPRQIRSLAMSTERSLLMEASTAIPVDPRVIAEALHMDDTSDLARVLTKWAGEALPQLDFDRKWEPTPLEDFDAAVDRSRALLVSAHAAMDAWNEDNPFEDNDAA